MSQKITIHGELFSSKNSKKIITNPKYVKGVKAKGNRPYFLIESSASEKSGKSIKKQLLANKAQWEAMTKDQPFPLFVVFKLYRSSRRRYDFTNLIQGIADLMVKCEYLPDDNTQCFYPVPAQDEVDKENPRTEIWLLGQGEVANLTREQLTLMQP